MAVGKCRDVSVLIIYKLVVNNFKYYYSSSVRVAEYRMSRISHISGTIPQASPSFPHLLLVAVAGYSSAGVAIYHTLFPVLWIIHTYIQSYIAPKIVRTNLRRWHKMTIKGKGRLGEMEFLVAFKGV